MSKAGRTYQRIQFDVHAIGSSKANEAILVGIAKVVPCGGYSHLTLLNGNAREQYELWHRHGVKAKDLWVFGVEKIYNIKNVQVLKQWVGRKQSQS